MVDGLLTLSKPTNATCFTFGKVRELLPLRVFAITVHLTLSLEGCGLRFVLHALAKIFYEYYVRDAAKYCVYSRLPGSSPL